MGGSRHDFTVVGAGAILSGLLAAAPGPGAGSDPRGEWMEIGAEERTHLRSAAADSLGVGIAAVDDRGQQTYVNPAFARMLGWSPVELIGARPPFVYWPPEERERIEEAFTRTLRGEAAEDGFELRFMRRDGGRLDVLVSIDPLLVGGDPVGWVAAVIDITGLKSVQEMLREREQRLTIAMEAGRLGSWEWEIATGRVIWNDALERIHGLPVGGFGGTFEDYRRDIHPEDVDHVLETIARSSQGDAPHRLEYRIIRPDGQVRWLEARGAVFKHKDGTPLRMLGVCADVTERKESEEPIRHAMEEAERANRSKSEFLAAMSHELRTPLNAIGGHLDLVDLGIHGPVTEEQRQAIARIKRNQEHLLAIINDLLQFAKIDSGHMEYRIGEFALREVLEDVVPLIEPQAAERGIAWRHDASGADLRVQADRDRLQQILLNLLDNAVKFTPPGGSVTVGCRAEDGAVWIDVIDDGPGVPADKLDTIFDPFVQVSRTRGERSPKGTGLGLAISRDLARAMGGDLGVVSELGKGSTFTVRLRSAPDAF